MKILKSALVAALLMGGGAGLVWGMLWLNEHHAKLLQGTFATSVVLAVFVFITAVVYDLWYGDDEDRTF